MLEPGGAPHHLPEFLDYFAHDATFPWVSRALWFYTQMVRWKQVAASPAAAAEVSLAASDDGPTSFFDARAFDLDDVEGYLKSQSPPT